MATTRRAFMARLGALGAAFGLPGCMTAPRPVLQSGGALSDASSLTKVVGPDIPPAGTLSKEFWLALRSQFLIPPDEAFFNTGTAGASPRQVLKAMIDHMLHVDRDLAHWDYKPGTENYYSGYYPEEGLRKKFARLINADFEEVAITGNSTLGMNFVANGVTLAAGEEVIIMEDAHIGGRCGWELKAKRYGSVVKFVTPPIPPRDPGELIALYERASTPQTKVWAIPHLSSHAAIRFPVEEMCKRARERGILSVVDGAQTLGHLVIDVKAMGCDAYFSSPHKFLLAPKGTGVLFIRRELLPKIWTTLASAQWDNQQDGIYRLMQYGTTNLSLLKGVEAAIDFHMELQPARVQARIVGLADQLRAGLQKIPGVELMSSAHPALTSATVIYRVANVEHTRVQDELWNRGKVRVRQQPVPGAIRQCCHIYNSEEEIDRTLRILRDLVKT